MFDVESTKFVQSCLNSVGYPDTIEGFRHMVEERLHNSNSISCALNTDLFLEKFSDPSIPPVPLKNGVLDSWTCPRWFMVGDVSFFYHSRRAATNAPRIFNKIRSLRLNYRRFEEKLPLETQCPGRQWLSVLEAVAFRGAEFARKYGGKIFAVARADDEFEVIEPSPGSHWQSINYCGYSNVHILDNPLDYEDFRDVVSIEQRAISSLTKSQFEFLRNSIVTRNQDVSYLNKIEHRDTRLFESAELRGWRDLVRDSSIRFLFESQVREYILDPFLKEVFPDPYRICREVTCATGGIIDYVLLHNSVAIPIEAKCVFVDSRELRQQLSRYCNARLRERELRSAVTNGRCLLLDQHRLTVFDSSEKDSKDAFSEISTLYSFAKLDVDEIRKSILGKIHG